MPLTTRKKGWRLPDRPARLQAQHGSVGLPQPLPRGPARKKLKQEETAMLPTPGFHHIHLNSVDPDRAIDFYTRQFPTTAKGSWGGFAGAPIAERRAGAVHQGRPAADERAAECDLAFRLACDRRPPQPRNLQDPARGRAVAALYDRRGRLGADQQRHLAQHRQCARPEQGADRRGQGQGDQAGRRRRLFLYARPRRGAGRICRQPPGRAFQPCAPVPGRPDRRARMVSAAPERAVAAGLRADPASEPAARPCAGPTAPGRP